MYYVRYEVYIYMQVVICSYKILRVYIYMQVVIYNYKILSRVLAYYFHINYHITLGLGKISYNSYYDRLRMGPQHVTVYFTF